MSKVCQQRPVPKTGVYNAIGRPSKTKARPSCIKLVWCLYLMAIRTTLFRTPAAIILFLFSGLAHTHCYISGFYCSCVIMSAQFGKRKASTANASTQPAAKKDKKGVKSGARVASEKQKDFNRWMRTTKVNLSTECQNRGINTTDLKTKTQLVDHILEYDNTINDEDESEEDPEIGVESRHGEEGNDVLSHENDRAATGNNEDGSVHQGQDNSQIESIQSEGNTEENHGTSSATAGNNANVNSDQSTGDPTGGPPERRSRDVTPQDNLQDGLDSLFEKSATPEEPDRATSNSGNISQSPQSKPSSFTDLSSKEVAPSDSDSAGDNGEGGTHDSQQQSLSHDSSSEQAAPSESDHTGNDNGAGSQESQRDRSASKESSSDPQGSSEYSDDEFDGFNSALLSDEERQGQEERWFYKKGSSSLYPLGKWIKGKKEYMSNTKLAESHPNSLWGRQHWMEVDAKWHAEHDANSRPEDEAESQEEGREAEDEKRVSEKGERGTSQNEEEVSEVKDSGKAQDDEEADESEEELYEEGLLPAEEIISSAEEGVSESGESVKTSSEADGEPSDDT